ncbi:MAG: hypothetical protein AB1634_00570 [Thermodesulfobacteriota bacterium]
MSERKLASGVQALIDRLREEGIRSGQEEAERLLEEARAEATRLLHQARQEAEAIRRQARTEAERTRAAASEALSKAARDTVIDLKERLGREFGRRVGEMVSAALADEGLLEKLILEIGRQAAPLAAQGPVTILLPEDVVGLDELRRAPERVREGALGSLTLAVSQGTLREGVHIATRPGSEAGILVRLEDEDLVIDLSASAITDLLLVHLQPRFRALLEGSIG